MKRYITHVVNEDLPLRGVRSVSCITITDDTMPEPEYFIGETGNIPLSESAIGNLIRGGAISPIHSAYPELKEGTSLFVDSAGNLFLAEKHNSDLNRAALNIKMS